MEDLGRNRMVRVVAAGLLICFSSSTGVLGQKKQRNGPSLTVTIRPLVEDVQVGDPIPVEFTIHNTGRKAFEYLDRDYDRGGRMGEYQLIAQTEEGATLPDFREDIEMGGLAVTKKLLPGQHFSKTIFLNRWALVTSSGRYRVTGAYHAQEYGRTSAEAVHASPTWITVKPRTHEEMLVTSPGSNERSILLPVRNKSASFLRSLLSPVARTSSPSC